VQFFETVRNDQNSKPHHLEISGAEACLADIQCVSLGLEIDQLKKTLLGGSITNLGRLKEKKVNMPRRRLMK